MTIRKIGHKKYRLYSKMNMYIITCNNPNIPPSPAIHIKFIAQILAKLLAFITKQEYMIVHAEN